MPACHAWRAGQSPPYQSAQSEGSSDRARIRHRGRTMSIALPAETARRPGGFDLSWPILILFSAVLCVLIVLPMSWLVYYSLVDRTGAFTLQNFVTLFSDAVFVDPLVTTVIIATSSSVI